MKAGTNLEKVLENQRFAVTAEVGPPKGAGTSGVLKKGEQLKNFTDAINVTDNQTAIVRMCSLAGCTLLKRVGVDPVLQMVVRDRNRIALQSDILGAAAMGIGNILCLSGGLPVLRQPSYRQGGLRPGFGSAHPNAEENAR